MKSRETLSLNYDWRFHLGDIHRSNFEGIHTGHFPRAHWMKAKNHGLSTPAYPDEDWRNVDLPHDFVVEGKFSPDNEQVHGSLPQGIAWYRKTFIINEQQKGRRVCLEFDGICRNWEVWCNGYFVGRELSSFSCVSYDVSELLDYGTANTIAVRVDCTDIELWSYEGGGIYRDVRMVITDPVHTAFDGVYVRSMIDESDLSRAELEIETSVQNNLPEDNSCVVVSKVIDPDGTVVKSVSGELKLPANADSIYTHSLDIEDIKLWELDSPFLYTLETIILSDDREVDKVLTEFGLRVIRVCPDTGFYLNGKNIKLKGVCNHQDHGGVGVAIPEALDEWRVKKLKSMGANAIRSAHNPASRSLLRACDKLGMMIMDEVRQPGTTSEYQSLVDSMIKRGRNHPSIIFWSLGNEEWLIHNTKSGIAVLKKMHERIKRLDSSRPVTYACNMGWIDTCDLWKEQNFRTEVFGTNYRSNQKSENYDIFHQKHPDWPLAAVESGGSLSQRGIYDWTDETRGVPYQHNAVWNNVERRGLISSYSETWTPWGYSIQETWQDCIKRPFLMGTFLWTGFDYRGETFPLEYPAVITSFGLMDICGFPKDAYWYYRAWWREEPLLHVFPHWNWPGKEGRKIDVWCYTNCAEVELLLNNKPIDRKKVEQWGHLEFKAVYEPGKLEARGYDAKDSLVLSTIKETTGPAVEICLESDRMEIKANKQDLAVVTVSVRDKNGVQVPDADDLISFSLSGSGTILGVANGNPLGHEPDKAEKRKLYQGLCQVLVQAGRQEGEIILKAKAEGLRSASLSISSMRQPDLSWLASVQSGKKQKMEDSPMDGAL